MKNLAYYTAAYIALMMSLAQIEEVQSNVYFEMFLLVGFNAGGLLAFRAAGEYMKEDITQGYIILIGGVLIRLYTYWHIRQVFTGEMVYTMYACNSVILVFELAIFFAHWPKSQMRDLKKQSQDWERYANQQERKTNQVQSRLDELLENIETLKSKNEHLETQNAELKQNAEHFGKMLQNVPAKQAETKKKRSTKQQPETDEETGKRFIVKNYETMSQRQMAEKLGVSASTINRWKKSLNGQLNPA